MVVRLVVFGFAALFVTRAWAQDAVDCPPVMPAYQPCDRHGAVQCSAFWPQSAIMSAAGAHCTPAAQISREIHALLVQNNNDVHATVRDSTLQSLREILGHVNDNSIAFWVLLKNTSGQPVTVELPVLIGTNPHGGFAATANLSAAAWAEPQGPAGLYRDLAADYAAGVPATAWRSQWVDLQPNEVAAVDFKFDKVRTRGVDGMHVLALFREPALDTPQLASGYLLTIGAQAFYDHDIANGIARPARPHW